MANQFKEKELKQAKKQAENVIDTFRKNVIPEMEKLSGEVVIRNTPELTELTEGLETELRGFISKIRLSLIDKIEKQL